MPEVQEVFEAIRLGGTVPTPPVLMVQAVHDSVIAVDDIDELADLTPRAARSSPTTATCSASTCCCTRCLRR